MRALFLLALAVGLPAVASAKEIILAPTGGVWIWDEKTFPDHPPVDAVHPVFGFRAGYAPAEALSAELTLLTGTADLTFPAGDVLAARAVHVEGSVLVHFRNLVRAPVYPFMAAGAGLVHHGGEAMDALPEHATGTVLGFHLGGGLRAEIGRSWAVRALARDTFFRVDQDATEDAPRITVDRIEISAALELRLDLGGAGGDRLR